MSIGRSCLRDKISAEARNRMNQFFIPRSVRPGKGFEPKFRSTSLIGSLRLRTLPRSSETGNRPHPKTINICVGLTQTSVRRKRLPLRWVAVVSVDITRRSARRNAPFTGSSWRTGFHHAFRLVHGIRKAPRYQWGQVFVARPVLYGWLGADFVTPYRVLWKCLRVSSIWAT